MYEFYDGSLENEIYITIDEERMTVPPETTILQAAQLAGIEIPTLCYLKGLTPTGACGMCVVEVEGEEVLQRACAIPCKDGMVIHTDTEHIQEYREERITQILTKHPNDCLACQKTGGNCRLQEISFLYDINPKVRKVRNLGIDDSSPAIIRDMDKCIGCRRCITMCDKVQKIGILEYVNIDDDCYVRTKKDVKLADTSCISCGQCVQVCPVAALTEKDSIQKALSILRNPEATVVWQISPATENTLGEEFTLDAGTDVTGKIVAAARRLGGYVYSSDFAYDVAIMEMSAELMLRIANQENLPMITSSCEGWNQYVKEYTPSLEKNLSTCKLPKQIFETLTREYLSQKLEINQENIYCICVTSCVGEKTETNEKSITLTTREFAKLLHMRGFDLLTLEDESFDEWMGCGSGLARICATTGGLTEAIFRTAHSAYSDKEMKPLLKVRGYQGIKEVEFMAGEQTIKVAVVNGIANAKKLFAHPEQVANYQLIEVMTCPGGCLNGGGSPRSMPEQVTKRMEKTYESSEKNPIHYSFTNPDVQKLYKDYLQTPCKEVAQKLLHTLRREG